MELENRPQGLSLTGKILIGVTGGFAVGLSVLCAPFVSPALRKFCLPYIPATKQQVSNIFKALEGQQGSLLDIGSGDGRIVLEAAERGFKSCGVELNLWLVLFSRIEAFRRGLKVKIFRGDLWKHDLKRYDNVVIFGVEQMMEDLERKFLRECKSTANVIACRFPLPNLHPLKTVGVGIDTVWFYKIKT